MHSPGKIVFLGVLFFLIISLSFGATALYVSKTVEQTPISKPALIKFPKAQIAQITQNTSGGITGPPQCNFDQPECTQEPYDCRCDANENEFTQLSITYDWNGIFLPGTPMCIVVDSRTLPIGASAPPATGIDRATITLTWTPTYCQAKNYLVTHFLGFTCDNLFYFNDYIIDVQNVNRLPLIQAVPAGPIETSFMTPVYIDVTATDPDTACTDVLNKDSLVLSQLQGPGTFVDHGNGDGDFDWGADTSGNYNVPFNVSDGKGGSAVAPVQITVNPVAPNPVQDEQPEVRKNRYISFVPGNAGKQTAIRVFLSELNNNHQKFFAFKGQFRWVGPPQDYPETAGFPQTLKAAKLQCEPFYTDWGAAGTVNVYGEEILPNSAYDVQAIQQGCNKLDERCYSAQSQAQTGKWGDIVAPFAYENIRPQPDILDVSAIVDKIKLTNGAPTKPMAQLRGQLVNPSENVNVLDIQYAIDALKGSQYPFDIATSCP